MRSLPGERLRDRVAEPLARAGDHRDLSFQSEIHVVSSSSFRARSRFVLLLRIADSATVRSAAPFHPLRSPDQRFARRLIEAAAGARVAGLASAPRRCSTSLRMAIPMPSWNSKRISGTAR